MVLLVALQNGWYLWDNLFSLHFKLLNWPVNLLYFFFVAQHFFELLIHFIFWDTLTFTVYYIYIYIYIIYVLYIYYTSHSKGIYLKVSHLLSVILLSNRFVLLQVLYHEFCLKGKVKDFCHHNVCLIIFRTFVLSFASAVLIYGLNNLGN